MSGLQNSVVQLGNLLLRWKGEDTLALRLDSSVSWARFCLLCTCNSRTHTHGILSQLRQILHNEEQLRHHGLLGLEARSLLRQDDAWCLVDLGDVILHLMSRQARQFYDLEHLWPVAETLQLTELATPSQTG